MMIEMQGPDIDWPYMIAMYHDQIVDAAGLPGDGRGTKEFCDGLFLLHRILERGILEGKTDRDEIVSYIDYCERHSVVRP